jgi:signal transduction histidine kinase
MRFDEIVTSGCKQAFLEQFADPHSESSLRNLETILAVVRKIHTSLVLSDVLNLVLDEVIRITHAERGFLMLANNRRALEFAVGRNAQGTPIDASNFQVSSSVLEDVFTTGESICIENAQSDGRFERRQSIMNLERQTIICSPLRTQEDTIGVIYVDSQFIHAIDKADILNLFEILTGQAATAIKNARLYDQLRTAYEELKKANAQIVKFERLALKGEIAAEVSHELKNHVGVVMLGLGLLETKIGSGSPDDLRSILAKTMRGADRIGSFSRNILLKNRPGAKKTPAHINDVVQDFIRFIKFLPRFKDNNIEHRAGTNIPVLLLDTDQIQQMLLNLANNAVEASRDALLVFTTTFNPAEQMVCLRVSDNGPGIEESVLSRLFTEKITPKTDGHGYGLGICKTIVEDHGGAIQIESTVGSGTTFILTFPVAAS